jgi:hypothetical protein
VTTRFQGTKKTRAPGDVGITEARDRGGGVGNPRGLREHAAGPGSAPGGRGSPRRGRAWGRPSLPRAGQHSHFLLPTVVFITGIEIDIDRPRFAPSFFATSRVASLLPSILRLFFGDPPREKFVRLEPAVPRGMI